MKLFENISLKPYTTFGIDVKARRLMMLEPGDEVPPLDGNVLVLGEGSNMVFTRDYDGTVITLAHSLSLSTPHSPLLTVWGGMVMDNLVQWTLDHDLFGLENLSAIPGTVGASAVQNVGAYGAEAKDFIENVEAYNLLEQRLCNFSNADCQFAYRDSFFKHHPGRYIILNVTYRLNQAFVPNLSYKALENLPHGTAHQLRQSIIDLRWSKLPRPEEHGSAGSFFKNPVVDEQTYLRLKSEHNDMPDAHPLITHHSSLTSSPPAGSSIVPDGKAAPWVVPVCGPRTPWCSTMPAGALATRWLPLHVPYSRMSNRNSVSASNPKQ